MEYKIFSFGDTDVVYGIENGQATLVVVPSGSELNEEKMRGIHPFGQAQIEPSMQIALESAENPGNYTAGKTYRNNPLSFDFGIPQIDYSDSKGKKRLVATYSAHGLIARQIFEESGKGIIDAYCEAENCSEEEITLESVPSFSISRLSPFVRNNRDAQMYVYRMRNYWSSEGVLIKTPIGELAFEDSWGGLGVRTDIFGHIGSTPANGFLPWVAVEDASYGCVWAVALEAPASWQIELCHVYNGLSLSGGQADFRFGHWKKTLKAGELFRTHRAYLTVVKGDIFAACRRLTARLAQNIEPRGNENEMPVLYNEYCYSWGNPNEKSVLAQLEACKRYGLKYFVIDAGWYRTEGEDWNVIGDWRLNLSLFPHGLNALSAECARLGITLGIWFEFECVSPSSEVAGAHPDWLLTYCGKTIRRGTRYMLDLRKTEVVCYLREKVIGFLKENRIGYLKVDYNDSIGIGVDGAESLGEGLRLQAEAAMNFYREIRSGMPGLIVEICASGGMRHEPLWLSLGSMCSFSDAHENAEGALVACNLHRFLPARQMQIWAAFREGTTAEAAAYTLVKSMLGRICLSGDLIKQSDEVKNEIAKALAFYETIKEIVRDGETVNITSEGIDRLQNAVGTETLTRLSQDGKRMLIYLFALREYGQKLHVAIETGWHVSSFYGNCNLKQEGTQLSVVTPQAAEGGCVVLLQKEKV